MPVGEQVPDPDPRIDPPQAGGEAETLLGFLDYHRDTLRMKTSGLDAAQLAQRLPPSTLTLGGMLKHLSVVEESWLSEVFLGHELGEPWASVDWRADRDWDWHSAALDTPAELRELFDRAVSNSRRIIVDAIADGGLDRLSVRPDRRNGEPFSLRWILVHLIEEYARHNGHADLIRESIDGTTGQ